MKKALKNFVTFKTVASLLTLSLILVEKCEKDELEKLLFLLQDIDGDYDFTKVVSLRSFIEKISKKYCIENIIFSNRSYNCYEIDTNEVIYEKIDKEGFHNAVTTISDRTLKEVLPQLILSLEEIITSSKNFNPKFEEAAEYARSGSESLLMSDKYKH